MCEYRRRLRAFSLVEVVIAVGLFASAVVVTLGMLPALARQATDATDTLTVQRLPDAVRLELERLAVSGGFDALRTNLPLMNAPLTNGLALVASRDGVRLHTVSYLPPAAASLIPQGEQYFAVEVWSFSPGQFNHDPNALLPAYVRVSWPYRNPGAATDTPLADRQQFTFAVALNR